MTKKMSDRTPVEEEVALRTPILPTARKSASMDFGFLSWDLTSLADGDKTNWEANMGLPTGTVNELTLVTAKVSQYVAVATANGEPVDAEEISDILEEMDALFHVPYGITESCLATITLCVALYGQIADRISAASQSDPEYDHEQDPAVTALLAQVDEVIPYTSIETQIVNAQFEASSRKT